MEVGISKIKLFTPLGNDLDMLYQHYAAGKPLFTFSEKLKDWVLPIQITNEELIAKLFEQTGVKLDYVDRLALLALACSLSGDDYHENIELIVFGSSRGATELTERSITSNIVGNKLPVYTSPGTTLGNTASILAQHVLKKGMILEHSMTCSTGLQSILNGIAWIRAGLSKYVLAGAGEAPLTSYTIAQMKSLKIYAPSQATSNQLQMPFDKHSKGIVLSEGSILLEMSSYNPGMFKISGWGFETELQKNPVAANEQNPALINAMRKATKMAGVRPDVIIAHATGTIKGDQTELNAIHEVFDSEVKITATKWLTGHSFGLAGMHSIALAILMLQKQEFIGLPYQHTPHIIPTQLNHIMINTLGFGGQVISIIVSK